MSILDEAANLVDGDRRADYGDPNENHGRTAELWSAYLGVPVSPRQVCICMVLMKASRDAHAEKHDNLVDMAGWARNAELVTAGAEGFGPPPVLSSPLPPGVAWVCSLCGRAHSPGIPCDSGGTGL